MSQVAQPGYHATVDQKTAHPSLYKVVMLDDPFTPMEFVVDVLQKVFHKPSTEAEQLMLEVHHKGSGICGIYTKEVAETKLLQVVDLAKKKEHPLQCRLERT